MHLSGKRVLITRPRSQAEEFAAALLAEGAVPTFFPVIEILPPKDFTCVDHALQNLKLYDWLVFTSVNAVDAFFNRLDDLGVKEIPTHLQVAAIGSRTALHLSQFGIKPDHVPAEYVAEGLFSGLKNDIFGKRFLLPQSDLARDVLTKAIRETGGVVDAIVMYRNVLAQPAASRLEILQEGIDVVTFTSPSTVRNFITVLQQNGMDPFRLPGYPIFACIGPITKKTAEEAGFSKLITASEYTTNGLVEALTRLVYS